jgi:formate hydrogenlyase transcriptional activator
VRSAEQQAARERDRIKLLMVINNAVVSHLELGDLVKTISANLLGILPHEGAGIALYEPEQNLLREYENVAYERFAAFQKGMAIPLEGTSASQSSRNMGAMRPPSANLPTPMEK